MKAVSATMSTIGQGLRLIVNKSYKLYFASLNFETMKGRANKVGKPLARRRIDLCCDLYTNWKSGSARMMSDKNCI